MNIDQIKKLMAGDIVRTLLLAGYVKGHRLESQLVMDVGNDGVLRAEVNYIITHGKDTIIGVYDDIDVAVNDYFTVQAHFIEK